MGEITEIDREGKMRTFLTKFTREKIRFCLAIFNISIVSHVSRLLILRSLLTGHLPMSQKIVQTQNRQFSRNLYHSTLSWSKLTTQNIFDL